MAKIPRDPFGGTFPVSIAHGIQRAHDHPGKGVIHLNASINAEKAEILREREIVSCVLSVLLPGLGHLYKGHVRTGLLVMFLGLPAALWSGLLLSLATAGVGLLVPVLFWAAVAVSAYFAEDHRKHHVLDVF